MARHMYAADRDANTRAMMGAPAGSLRSTLAAGSAAGADAAFRGAAGVAGEQQGAWNALTNAAGTVRAADLTGDTAEAKLSQTAALANAGFRNQATIANQSAAQNAIGNRIAAASMYGGLAADDVTARLQWDGMKREQVQKTNAWKQATKDRNDAGTAQAIGTIGAAVGMMSDERGKTDVRDGEGDLRAMYDALAPYEYEYRDTSKQGTSPGTHVSVMAQDLERSKIGKRAVRESPEGHKLVDYAALAPAQVAATAWLHKRVEDLEDKLGAHKALGGGK